MKANLGREGSAYTLSTQEAGRGPTKYTQRNSLFDLPGRI